MNILEQKGQHDPYSQDERVEQAMAKGHKHEWERLPGGAFPRRRCDCGAYERMHGDFFWHRHDNELKAAVEEAKILWLKFGRPCRY